MRRRRLIDLAFVSHPVIATDPDGSERSRPATGRADGCTRRQPLLGLPEQLIECERASRIAPAARARGTNGTPSASRRLRCSGVGLTATRKRDATLRIDDPVPGQAQAAWRVAQRMAHESRAPWQSRALGDPPIGRDAPAEARREWPHRCGRERPVAGLGCFFMAHH